MAHQKRKSGKKRIHTKHTKNFIDIIKRNLNVFCLPKKCRWFFAPYAVVLWLSLFCIFAKRKVNFSIFAEIFSDCMRAAVWSTNDFHCVCCDGPLLFPGQYVQMPCKNQQTNVVQTIASIHHAYQQPNKSTCTVENKYEKYSRKLWSILSIWNVMSKFNFALQSDGFSLSFGPFCLVCCLVLQQTWPNCEWMIYRRLQTISAKYEPFVNGNSNLIMCIFGMFSFKVRKSIFIELFSNVLKLNFMHFREIRATGKSAVKQM